MEEKVYLILSCVRQIKEEMLKIEKELQSINLSIYISKAKVQPLGQEDYD